MSKGQGGVRPGRGGRGGRGDSGVESAGRVVDEVAVDSDDSAEHASIGSERKEVGPQAKV